jgi:hypothetical protein
MSNLYEMCARKVGVFSSFIVINIIIDIFVVGLLFPARHLRHLSMCHVYSVTTVLPDMYLRQIGFLETAGSLVNMLQ